MNDTYFPCYFILMSQKDFLENQVIEEVLRERANYYISKNKLRNFWIVNSPNFVSLPKFKTKIINSNFYKQKVNQIVAKLNNKDYEFYTALITFDYEFIKWIQLRIGYFEDISTISSPSIHSYISDGIYGKFDLKDKLNNQSINSDINSDTLISVFTGASDRIHPDILTDRYKRSIEVYYNIKYPVK